MLYYLEMLFPWIQFIFLNPFRNQLKTFSIVVGQEQILNLSRAESSWCKNRTTSNLYPEGALWQFFKDFIHKFEEYFTHILLFMAIRVWIVLVKIFYWIENSCIFLLLHLILNLYLQRQYTENIFDLFLRILELSWIELGQN